MMKILDDLRENKTYMLGFIILLIIIILSSSFVYFYLSYELKKDDDPEEQLQEEYYEEDITNQKIVVEIRGEVVNPGVYEVNLDKRVNDVIFLAGGLTDKADTSSNNLSKKVEDEMLIIIYSKDEIKNYLKKKEEESLIASKCQSDTSTESNSCIESDSIKETSETSSKVSLNTGSKSDLMTLPGIGESKALAIIQYREKKKFETIEEVKEVSGIGDSLYAKIKDFITT